jgi:hypothetical protein
MMTHDEMIAVITHHKNGGKVEYKAHGAETWIKLLTKPLWNFAHHNYRIEPEPMVIFAEVSYITGQVLRASIEPMFHTGYKTTIKKFIEEQ